jgi:hypothetical protein
MRTKAFVLILVLAGWLAGCGAPTPAPTGTPAPTVTPLPSSTPQPSATRVPTEATLLYGNRYSDTAIPVWNGIPVMSGAIRGNGDNTTYRFATNAAPEKIQSFYKNAMGSLGWTLSSADNQVGTIVMIFNHAKENIVISITPQAAFNLVVLTKR